MGGGIRENKHMNGMARSTRIFSFSLKQFWQNLNYWSSPRFLNLRDFPLHFNLNTLTATIYWN